MSEKGIQVIDRAFDILELLAIEKEGLGVTEIGNRLGLHKSTVYRILSAMFERGYVEKKHPTNSYKVGLKVIELSSIYLSEVELMTEARPYLWELASRLNTASHLAILNGLDAVYIEKINLASSIRLYSQIGSRIPAYCSALGKSLLSGLPEKDLKIIVNKIAYKKLTDKTITDAETFLKEILETKIKGWSIDDEEHDEGIRCIAAPIYDYRNEVIAALSISALTPVLPSSKDIEIGKLVSDTALKVSEKMGFKK